MSQVHSCHKRPGKVRAATKAKTALVNAMHTSYHGEDIGTEHPDHNITQHTSTGLCYPSIHASYASMHACDAAACDTQRPQHAARATASAGRNTAGHAWEKGQEVRTEVRTRTRSTAGRDLCSCARLMRVRCATQLPPTRASPAPPCTHRNRALSSFHTSVGAPH